MIRPLAEVEKDAILEATLLYLNYTLAAQKLGISARTVKRKMREYGYTMVKLRELKYQRTRQGMMHFIKQS
jgi:DNA-directed RNA polymerase specialized sigma24 family protein